MIPISMATIMPESTRMVKRGQPIRKNGFQPPDLNAPRDCGR
jgi:hypothetical protein